MEFQCNDGYYASFFVCLTKCSLLALHTPESRGSFVTHSSGQTQYGDENTKGEDMNTLSQTLLPLSRVTVSKYSEGVM